MREFEINYVNFEYKRDLSGDLTLPFFGFVLVAALTIASLTSLSQYNIMVEKLNAGLEEANKASVQYILDNVSDSALIGSLSPAVTAELANARDAGIAAAEATLSNEIKDLIAVRNGNGVNVFDITDSSITKDASDNVIIQFAVEAQVLPLPTPKYKRVYKKVIAKPFSLNSRSVCTELSCPPGDCGECGACDECTGKCVPDFSVPDGSGGFKNPDTATATADNIACAIDDPCAVIGDGWETYEEHGITGCIKDNCKYLPNHHTVNRSTESIGGGFFAQPGSKFRVGVRPECDPSTGCTSNFPLTTQFIVDNLLVSGEPVGFTELCIAGNSYSIGPETTMSDLSDNIDDPGEQTYAICSDPFEHSSQEYTIFITNERMLGDINSKANADSKCANEALNAGLPNPGLYKAIIDFGTDVSSYLDSDAAFFLPSGTSINSCPMVPRTANSYNEYPLDNVINERADGFTVTPAGPLSEFLQPVNFEAGVWTGYNFASGKGEAASDFTNCAGWTSSSYVGITQRGRAQDFQSTQTWLGNLAAFSFSTQIEFPCNGQDYGGNPGPGFRLYCFGPR